jgi:tRNA dimethylallyltransferase
MAAGCQTGRMAGPPIVAVVGATAAGKTGLSLDLAERLGGEIVNTDAMAVYRGMDIGTATPPPAERRGVPHHLLDLLDVTEPLTVAEFQGWARDVIAEVRARRRIPILVGGSALYTRAVVDRFEFPGTDAAVRAGLEAELAAVGPAALHRRLSEQDPESAAQILPGNGRRIVRALEVMELTGEPFRASLPEYVYAFSPVVQIGLDVPRDVLDARIEQRVARMWSAGLVDEVRRLERAGLREGRTASRALGYRQVLDVLAGVTDEHSARSDTVRLTRRFARRQLTWFRRDPRIYWLPYDDPALLQHALDAVRSVA